MAQLRLLTLSASAALVLLAITTNCLQTVEAGYGLAASSATAGNRGNGRAVATSAAAAQFGALQATKPAANPVVLPPPVSEQQPSPPRNKKQKQIIALLHRLNKIESGPSFTLAECQKWADLNDRYIKLAGIHRKIRPAELAKQQQCEALGLDADDNFNKIYNFKGAILGESNQLDVASNLISDYADIKAAIGTNQAAADEFNNLRADDPQFNYAVDRLDSFVKFLDTKISAINGGEVVLNGLSIARSGYVLTQGEIDDVEKAIRVLINREGQLNDDESNELLELSDALERSLTDGVSLDAHTGRWRYLFGAMEAARGLVLRKLRGDEPEPPAPPATVAVADAGAYAASFANAGANWSGGARADSVASAQGNRVAIAGSVASAANHAGHAAATSAIASDWPQQAPQQPAYDPREEEAYEAEAQALAEADAGRAAVAQARAEAAAKRAQAVANARAKVGPAPTPQPASTPARPAQPTQAISSAAAFAQSAGPQSATSAPRRRYADYAAAQATAATRTN